jgi:hydrogenase/urease accessory protein HupE
MCLGAILRPTPLEAHLVTTGLGPLYDGVSHLLMSPTDLFPVLAMSMLGGLNGAVAGRCTLFALPVAWLLGGLTGIALGGSAIPESAAASSLLLVGLLVAVDRRLPPVALLVLGSGVGLLHGYLNGGAITGGKLEALSVVGIGTAVFVVVALIGALVVSLRTTWSRMAVRVAGSWITALGLLMLGWSLRGLA